MEQTVDTNSPRTSDRPDVFLSYSRLDSQRAKAFADALTQEGFDVWWDVNLRSGEPFDKALERALVQARTVVVLWTKNSVESNWVRSEASVGYRLDKLFPVMLEECDLPVMFELVQATQILDWQGNTLSEAWRDMVAGLTKAIEKRPKDQDSDPILTASEGANGAVRVEPSRITPPSQEPVHSWRRKILNYLVWGRTDPNEHEKMLIVTWFKAFVALITFFLIPAVILSYMRP